ncbi:MAG: hypothetical protein ACRD3O_23800, partial [Terriglobia bacterium]
DTQSMKMTPHPPSYLGHPLPPRRPVIYGLTPALSRGRGWRACVQVGGRSEPGEGFRPNFSGQGTASAVPWSLSIDHSGPFVHVKKQASFPR